MPPTRTLLPAALLVVLATAAIWPVAGPAEGQASDLGGVPQAPCGPGSDPEGEIQGRVPAEDYDSGRADRPYTCNTELVGHHGSTGGFKVHGYVDAQGQECAFYDSTLLLPTDLVSQTSTGAGVIVLDMSDPANPTSTAQLTTPAMLSPHESLALNEQRGLLVAVTGTAATYPGVVDVYDVSQDCLHPALQASAPVGVLGHESGFSPDGLTFYATSTAADSIVAVDLTDPTTPTPVALLPLNSHGITVSADGTRLYTTPIDVSDQIPGPPSLGAFEGGIAILDVSAVQAREPGAQATVLSTLTWPEASIPQTAIPVTIDGAPYLVEIDEFVSFRDAGDPQSATPGAARIIDIGDETAPRVVSNIRLEVHDPEIRNSNAGLEGDPGNAYGPGSFAQGYAGHYCAVPREDDPGIVACSMIASGLRVFDITDPGNPVEVAYFNTITPDNNPASSGGAYAMSAPAFVPERNEIWYSDVNSGFHAVRLTNDAWPDADGLVQRLAGPTRIETAVAASRDTFADGAAGSAVLVRADDFADALAGGPLAVAEDGPLLLSTRDVLPAATAEELARAVRDGAVVHLLGGEAALSSEVARAVEDLGHPVVRHGGTNRFETAAIIAREALEEPAELVVADGTSFADAVVAAPVAASRGGALLLTDGATLPEATGDLLAAHAEDPLTVIGADAGQAVTAPDAVRVDGRRTGDLSVDVAQALFGDAGQVGIARGDDFPDALTAGTVLGRPPGAPVLLVTPSALPAAVADHLRQIAQQVRRTVIFGGAAAVGEAVEAQITAALDG